MRLIIAEKPSLARMIADAIGVTKTEKVGKMSNYVCGDDIVAAAVGHVFELMKMEDYDETYKVWANGTYPFMPNAWQYKKKEDLVDVIDNIESLLKRASCVVNAGDADREGQLLIDEILEYFRWSGEAYRLLITDTNPEAIRKSLASMKPNGVYLPLSTSGKARSMADWLLGMNMSRVCSLKGGANISVGRVQTPLVGLVVRRDDEIKNFKPKDYWSPLAIFKASSDEPIYCKWKHRDDQDGIDEDGRLVDESVRNSLESKVKSAIVSGDKASVLSVEKKPGKKNPPMPHSLPTLQIEASEKCGTSPADTLALVQLMYERGVVTYPRSDCAYLPTSIHADAEKILSGVKSCIEIMTKIVDGADPSLKSAAFNDSKVAEHFAIIPTGKADKLSDKERAIYELIATRFALQFYPAHEFLETKGEVSFAGETFTFSGRETTVDGWRPLYKSKDDDNAKREEEDAPVVLPPLAAGDTVSPTDIKMKAKKTTPPKPFTDATLLKAMNGIHNYVSDPEIKKVLKENDGLGTAATQAKIIERIEQVGYVAHEGKKIVSTEKGKTLIANLPDALTTPDRTALWEMEMKKIAEGGMTLDSFISDVFGEIQKLTAEVNSSQNFAFKSEGRGGDPKFPCFVCKTPMRRIARKDGSGHFWKCTSDECGKIFDDVKGKPVKPVGCPKCGKELAKRTRKNDGKPFWMCSCGLFLDDDGGKPIKTRKCSKCGGLQKQLVAKSGSKYWKCADDKCGAVEFEDSKTRSVKKGR